MCRRLVSPALSRALAHPDDASVTYGSVAGFLFSVSSLRLLLLSAANATASPNNAKRQRTDPLHRTTTPPIQSPVPHRKRYDARACLTRPCQP